MMADWSPATDVSLSHGACGLALFHAYFGRVSSQPEALTAAAGLLDWAMDQVSVIPMGGELFGGLAGVGWALTHLQEHFWRDETDDPLGALDRLLLTHLYHPPQPGVYDLIDGLVGLGVYALERLPRPDGVELCSRVVQCLGALAERSPSGVTWLTPPDRVPASQQRRAPHGYYNLGVAHGVAGVIAFLALCCKAGVARSVARPILDGAVAWLCTQQLSDPSRGAFPPWVGPGILPHSTRTAWCYGDPGIAATLLLAARCVGERRWEEVAMSIARRAARQPAADSGVVDAGFCHGAAGLAHLFNRMYQATGDPVLREGASTWMMRLLAMRQPGKGLAGYEAWIHAGGGRMIWQGAAGLLVGVAGIALVLLAAAAPVEPAWDRVFLVAIPPC